MANQDGKKREKNLRFMKKSFVGLTPGLIVCEMPLQNQKLWITTGCRYSAVEAVLLRQFAMEKIFEKCNFCIR
jgi:hypothetical protein